MIELLGRFLARLFPREPDYFIYTHRRGWIHVSRATEQDEREMSGFMLPYVK